MKIKVIIFFALLLVIINGSVYFVSKINAQERIDLTIEDNLQTLQTHYEILRHTYKETAEALYIGTVEKKRVIEILSKVQNLNEKEKKPFREELQKLLTLLYKRAKIKNVLQYHFVLPDNESFLRMHKPSKFGDDLEDIRADFKYTNRTKKPITGFVQGRTSHGFRNIFPIFGEDKNYLGAMEISFSSDNLQWYLNDISHIHTHFLVDKKIFKTNAWERNDLLIEYVQSSENSQYMLALGDNHSQEICIKRNAVKLQPILDELKQKMTEAKQFSKYIEYDGRVEVISFIPIKNLSDVPVAWLVSYEESIFIELTKHSIKMVRTVAFLFSLFLIFMIFREIKRREREDYEEHIFSLVNIIDKRDSYTAGHTHRVAEYSLMVAKEMGFSKREQDKIYKAGILHDIGKISTPDSILLKPGKLNRLEFEIIKEHSEVGYELLKQVGIYKEIAEIMRHHHERYDGGGYPQGLKGNEIPLLAQIMALTDAFDAMTTNRIYKPKKSVVEAIEEIKELSAKQFHPKVVKAAIRALASVKIEEKITQEPKTKMEKERFSYFYKDQVSGGYNRDYLEVTLAYSSEERLKTSCINIIYLNNFSQYNKKNGWNSGDVLLRKIAESLNNIDEDALVFRVYGDDFVVLSRKHCDIEEYIPVLDGILLGTNVSAKYKHYDIGESDTMSMSKLDELI